MTRTGRAKLALKKKRSERVPVMFTAKELEIIQQRDQQAGQPVSTWVREQVLKALEAA
jgi:mobilization protein NikA